MSATCIFCEILAGSAEASVVWRDADCVAFMDLHPVNEGHTLVCPVRHVSSMTDLEAAEISAMVAVAQRVMAAQKAALPDCEGVNLLLADGEAAGQEVMHVHFHVLPRARGDGFGWRRGGSIASREALDSAADTLREQLSSE